MRTISRLLQLRVVNGDIDTWLLRSAQVTCFVIAAFVLVGGFLRASRLDVTEVQFLSAVQQVVQTGLLLTILGLLLHPKPKEA